MKRSLMFLIIVALCSVSLFPRCKKKEKEPVVNNVPPRVEDHPKYISKDDIKNLMILLEYQPVNVATVGNKKIIVGIDFDGPATGGIFPNIMHLENMESISVLPLFDTANGITALPALQFIVRLTRNESGEIIIDNITNTDSTDVLNTVYTLVYRQLIRKGNYQPNEEDSYYADPLSNAYYRFSRGKWLYSSNGAPSLENTRNAGWSYVKATKIMWYGQDNAATQFRNNFFFISKGNGWKGQKKDYEILIIGIYEPNSPKAIVDPVVHVNASGQ